MAGLEKSDENWLYEECKRRGFICVKLTLLIGIPDRLLLAPGARVAFAELKTAINDLSPMQRWWQNKLRTLGFFAECVNTRPGLVQLLDWLETKGENHETENET